MVKAKFVTLLLVAILALQLLPWHVHSMPRLPQKEFVFSGHYVHAPAPNHAQSDIDLFWKIDASRFDIFFGIEALRDAISHEQQDHFIELTLKSQTQTNLHHILKETVGRDVSDNFSEALLIYFSNKHADFQQRRAIHGFLDQVSNQQKDARVTHACNALKDLKPL